MCAGVGEELLAKLFRQENRANLALEPDLSATALHCLTRDIAQFAHTDACGADRFDHKRESPLAAPLGGGDKARVVALGEITTCVAKEPALTFKEMGAALLPPQ